MEDLLNLLNSNAGQQLVSGASAQTGLQTNQVQNVLSMALPVLMGALNRNTDQPGGADALMNALGKHDGSILDNVMGFLQGGDFTDGNNILGHILGGSQGNVQNAISKSTGVDAGSIGKILAMVAPLIMGYLGRHSQQNGLNSNGLSSVLTGLMGNFSQNNQQGMGMVEKLIDQNHDGSVMDDVASMGMSLLQNFMK